MHPLAEELNQSIKEHSPILNSLLSDIGKALYMPRGIIFQSGEAKKKAHQYNATIGIATAQNQPMTLHSISRYFQDLPKDQIFEYAPSGGDLKLREKWQEQIRQKNQIKADQSFSLPVVTNGLTHGISTVSELFVNEGDDIILPDKFWGNYQLIFSVRKKANFIQFPLFTDNLTGFNLEGLKQALEKTNKKKVMVILNFPNNPTGYTPTESEVLGIVHCLKSFADQGKEVLVVTDDAYYSLFFEKDIPQSSIFSRFIGLHPNIASIKIDGITKEDYAWGLRIGFLTYTDYHNHPAALKALETKATASIRSTTSNCSRPVQSILLKAFSDPNYLEEKKANFNIIKKRAEKVKSIVYADQYKEYWSVYPFNSGYFMCLKIKSIDAETLREYILANYGVGTIAIGTDLRIAFSCVAEEELEKLFSIIAQSIDELMKKN
ncbi:MAG: aminotransferase class I/II-fold pyridoxal phosphate-dependent enzyme [Spirochaetes bacterium]|nr:aminotransferase class I/II-fold pyridoxal phosphate-dependent enzyme [Spirochaetota bacterium]